MEPVLAVFYPDCGSCQKRGFSNFGFKYNRLTSLELCVSSFLCGLRADLWPFIEFIETGLECSSEAVTCDQAYFPGKGRKKESFPLVSQSKGKKFT